MIGDFHFLRPLFLLLLPPLALLTWALWRKADAAQPWRRIIAPHLLPHLLGGQEARTRFGPIALIGLAWFAGTIAMAGPSWRREPGAFADETAALAIVVKVSPSMKTEDVQPDRLARSIQKIHDLLQARAGARTALIAYAGTAHVVMPATTDGGIVETFAQALDPHIMPAEGDVAADALRLAEATLAREGGGSILWITDSIAPEQMTGFTAWRKSSPTPLTLLPPLLPGAEFDALRKAVSDSGVRVIALTPDASDIDDVVETAKYAPVAADAPGTRWQDAGYFLCPVLALILLPFFRRGWMAPTAQAR